MFMTIKTKKIKTRAILSKNLRNSRPNLGNKYLLKKKPLEYGYYGHIKMTFFKTLFCL